MKTSITLLALAGIFQFASAQTAMLLPSSTKLAAEGGVVTLTAVMTYEGEPGAIGWSIDLPANWTLVSVVGPNLPDVRPATGDTGKLDFAYVTVPTHRAEFSLQVGYPPKTAAAVAKATALVRSGGKLETMQPASIDFAAAAL
jgi:hypothetical protein